MGLPIAVQVSSRVTEGRGTDDDQCLIAPCGAGLFGASILTRKELIEY